MSIVPLFSRAVDILRQFGRSPTRCKKRSFNIVLLIFCNTLSMTDLVCHKLWTRKNVFFTTMLLLTLDSLQKRVNLPIDLSYASRFSVIVVKRLAQFMWPRNTRFRRILQQCWHFSVNKPASVFRMHFYFALFKLAPEKTSRWLQHKGRPSRSLERVEKMLWRLQKWLYPLLPSIYTSADLSIFQIKSNFLASMSHELRTPFRFDPPPVSCIIHNILLP